eukprot:TRINITY_DN5568_c0_g1_i2.p1 TRINITY_DN5568_c0_g1~~TRINITY_DN5568_c0_g1_i2.p1  ORF type:complete len:863 (+),score=110.99 TRINITY_DN5568_c0_g1_i2:151-2739(+)
MWKSLSRRFGRETTKSRVSLIEPDVATEDYGPELHAEVRHRLPRLGLDGRATSKRPLLSHLHKDFLKSMESLDYAPIDNIILRERTRKQGRFARIQRNAGRWIICVAIGILVGLFAYCIKKVAEELADLKFRVAEHFMDMGTYSGVAAAFFSYSGICLGYALLATLCVILFGPEAGGSGIPEVIGYLNGVRVVHTINIRTFVGKVLSLLFAYSSSLAIGPEGPMIHIGAMIGGGMGQAKSRTLRLYPALLSQFRNDRDQRDFISSGAAAGVAAAFGAPVGGLLFSIEEASSFWSNKLTWRTFFCCMVAAFMVTLCMRGLDPNVSDTGMLRFGLSGSHLYNYIELLPFILIGIIGGLVGALFVAINLWLTRLRKLYVQTTFKKIGEVLLVMLVTAAFAFIISYTTPCRSEDSIEFEVKEEHAKLELVRMVCKEGEYSELGTLFFQTPDAALRTLFSRGRGVFALWPLALFSISYFLLAVSSSGMAIAAGLFVPTMLIGASMGRFVGEISYLVLSDYTKVDPSIYALLGAAAMLTGFSRLSLSIVVIVVELTENTQYLLPIILCVIVTRWTGDMWGIPLYEGLMDWKNIPYLPSHPPLVLRPLTILDVMSTDVQVVHDIEKVQNIVDLLANNTHNGFPVVSWRESSDGFRRAVYKGFILRKQLLVLLGNVDAVPIKLPPPGNRNIPVVQSLNTFGADNDDEKLLLEDEDDFMRRKSSLDTIPRRIHLLPGLQNSETAINDDTHTTLGVGGSGQEEETEEDDEEATVRTGVAWKGGRWGRWMSAQDFYNAMTHNDYSLDRITLSLRQRACLIDLRPYMNMSSVTVHQSWNLTEAYRLFRTLGLRHLPVVDENNEVVGMVTRKDLL